MAGNDERECLNQETRAGQALFTDHGGLLGMSRAVLMQPTQPTGIAELLVLRIQADELRVQNAEVSLSDQAMAQNLIYFVQWEQQLKQLALPDHMAQLVSALAGQLVQQIPPPQQVLPPTIQPQQDTTPPKPTNATAVAERMDMDVQEKEADQSDVQMDDGDRVHGSGSKGPMGDAEQT